MTETFQKEIFFRPAFDKRHPDPSKNYGVHGVELVFVLKGKRAAYQFVVFTNWHLPHVKKGGFQKPSPADVGYHAYEPQYDGHKPMDCTILGGKCYYDGSSLYADKVFDMLVSGGSDAVWKHLEELYMDRFCKEEPMI